MTTVVPADLALWNHRGDTLVPPNESTIQVQCPNCGGYRVTRSWLRATLDPPRFLPASTVATVMQWLGMIVTLLMVFGLLLLLSPYERGVLRGRYRIARQMIGYDCTCQLCGLRFTWLVADLHPPVEVKGDVVRQGAEKLRQEGEERRRRTDRAQLAGWVMGVQIIRGGLTAASPARGAMRELQHGSGHWPAASR